MSQYSKFPSFYIPASDCTGIIISCQPCCSARPGQQGIIKLLRRLDNTILDIWTTQQIVQTVRLNYLLDIWVPQFWHRSTEYLERNLLSYLYNTNISTCLNNFANHLLLKVSSFKYVSLYFNVETTCLNRSTLLQLLLCFLHRIKINMEELCDRSSILSWMKGLKAVFLFTYGLISMHGNVVRGNHIMAAWCFNCRAAPPSGHGLYHRNGGTGPGCQDCLISSSDYRVITLQLHHHLVLTDINS